VSEPLALPEDPQVEIEDVVEDSKVQEFEDFAEHFYVYVLKIRILPDPKLFT